MSSPYSVIYSTNPGSSLVLKEQHACYDLPKSKYCWTKREFIGRDSFALSWCVINDKPPQ